MQLAGRFALGLFGAAVVAPLAVLAPADDPEVTGRDAESALHYELAALSSNSKHITVEGATHYTLVSMQVYATPVTDAILQVVGAAGTGGMLAAEGSP